MESGDVGREKQTPAALAAWTLDRLVNRTDVWGAYLPHAQRVEGQSKVWTAPPKHLRGQVALTRERIARHFSATQPEHVIGLHSISLGNTSKWLGFDIDAHEPTPERFAANVTAVERLVERLVADGMHPVVEDSDGQGGYHVLVLFEAPASTARVHAYAAGLVHKLGLDAETFPKQPALPPNGYGNWLRLPGLHHTRPHYSRLALPGGSWQGAELLLQAPLTPISRLPLAVTPLPTQVQQTTRPGVTYVALGDRLTRRVQAYLDRLPRDLGVGEKRNNVAYSFACWLVRDLQLSDVPARTWLDQWNARQREPLSEAELNRVFGNAHSYARHRAGAGYVP